MESPKRKPVTGPPVVEPIERRKSARNSYCTAVSLRSIRGDSPGLVIDISADGMFVQTPVSFLKGEIIDLAFTYRSMLWTVSLTVEVVRTTSTGIGVRMLPS